MSTTIRYYTLNEFLRIDEDGHLDWAKCIRVLDGLVTALTLNPDQHVLIDLRGAVPIADFYEQRHKVPEILGTRLAGWYEGKIALLCSENTDYMQPSDSNIKALLAQGLKIKSVFDFESAINWLSEITTDPTAEKR